MSGQCLGDKILNPTLQTEYAAFKSPLTGVVITMNVMCDFRIKWMQGTISFSVFSFSITDKDRKLSNMIQ